MDKKQLEEIRAFVTHIEGVIEQDATGSHEIGVIVYKLRGIVEAELKEVIWQDYLLDKGEI